MPDNQSEVRRLSSSEARTILPIIPGQEPRLSYDAHTGRWFGTDAHFSIWMDDATFRAYVTAWCEWPQWLPDYPQEQRIAAAVAYCRRLRYWQDCKHNYDRRVHITYF